METPGSTCSPPKKNPMKPIVPWFQRPEAEPLSLGRAVSTEFFPDLATRQHAWPGRAAVARLAAVDPAVGRRADGGDPGRCYDGNKPGRSGSRVVIHFDQENLQFSKG